MGSLRNIAIRWLLIAPVLAALLAAADAQESKTVIGPSNPDLYHGANELLAGNAEEGVRLTLRGLEGEARQRDRMIAMSNLCAGYVMLKQLDTALHYCNLVLEKNDRHWRAYNNRALIYIYMERYEEAEKDLQKAEAIAANAKTVKVVRSMLLDATDPVAPNIVIDDRRQPPSDDPE